MTAVGAAHECVVLAHGGGGELTARLLREHVLPPLTNRALAPLTDGAVLPPQSGALIFTTDSYVVTPLEFPGGDIGRLAVCGTVNDLAVMGATPIALSLGLILEEGLPLPVLDRIVASIAAAATEAGVRIVTGDTKVIERRAAADSEPGLFINTAGIGRRSIAAVIDLARIAPGDALLINGPIAEHGLAVMSRRNGMAFDSEIASDVAPLNDLINVVRATGADIKFMRDATRGGLAGVLTDICSGTACSLEIDETRVPVARSVRHAAEALGLDPLTVANEGKCVFVVAEKDAARALEACRAHPRGQGAAIIGRVSDASPPLVELVTRVGGRRVVQRPYGEDLPRIC